MNMPRLLPTPRGQIYETRTNLLYQKKRRIFGLRAPFDQNRGREMSAPETAWRDFRSLAKTTTHVLILQRGVI
ncbi:hypothetical protein [uncultured Pyramidobacter sp.]|uniref:hypothetical protein n=1 Tax=uncultured Pyramidobacter sp. TaxID=1623495 RepID=UPI0028050F4E|nr:hypothetical protein [uncultured Pyramidobacter sp.]